MAEEDISKADGYSGSRPAFAVVKAKRFGITRSVALQVNEPWEHAIRVLGVYPSESAAATAREFWASTLRTQDDAGGVDSAGFCVDVFVLSTQVFGGDNT